METRLDLIRSQHYVLLVTGLIPLSTLLILSRMKIYDKEYCGLT